MKKLFTILFFVAISNFTNAQTTVGLMAHYPLDNSAVDASGNNYNGIFYGPTSTTNRFNQANKSMLFNGYGQYVSVSHNIWSDELTLSAWVYIDNFGSGIPSNQGKFIFFKAPNSGYNQDYVLAVSYINNIPKAQFIFGQSSGQYMNLISNSSLQANQWYLITATRKNGVAKLWINANLDANANYNFTLYNQNYNLKLGMSHDNAQSFSGKLDELRIYNWALEEEQIIDIYNEQPTGINTLNKEKISFNIFPNPSNGLFEIKFSHNSYQITNIQLFNSLGQMIYNTDFFNITDENSLKIDIKNLPKGIYSVLVKTKDHLFTKPLIID